MSDTDELVFFETPEVTYASNRFVNVPVILQYEDTPLIEVTQTEQAGFTTRFSIFNHDGVYLAKAIGSRLFTTDAGDKANLKLRHPGHVTVCELDGKTLFEIRRQEAAALRTEAELFTPDGRFMKANDKGMPASLVDASHESLRVAGVVMSGNLFNGCRIGVLVRSSGDVAIGVS